MSNNHGCGARIVFILFGSVFLGAGLVMLYFMAILPMSKLSEAKGWNETPGKVLWSRIRRYEDDEDGADTYNVEVLYEYSVAGEVHRSNTYSFMGGSSSGSSGKRKIVRDHPPGKEMVCYVNPEIPEQAVLNRDLSSIGFWWLFSVPFTLIGAAVLLRAIFASQSSVSSAYR